MSLFQPIKIFITGAGLVTSTSIWLFESTPAIPTPPIQRETDWEHNINAYDPVAKLTTRNGKSIEDKNLTLGDYTQGSGAHFTLSSDPNNKRYMSLVLKEQENFSIGHIATTKRQFKEFNIEDIKIHLFKQSAWYSSTQSDEYEENPIETPKVKELFEELDDVRVKQLLLSLQNRVEWIPLSTPPNLSYYSRFTWPQNLNDLKDLKIKHFNDFGKLKEYVKEKVKTCTNERETCVASVGELDYLETDKKFYIEKLWNQSQ